MKAKLSTKRLVALVCAAVLMVGAAGAYLSSTWALDPTWTAKQPNNYKTINKGEIETITVTGNASIESWGTSDEGIYATVDRINGKKGEIKGIKAGVATITAATGIGYINNLYRQVVDLDLMQNYALDSDKIEMKSKDKTDIQIKTTPSKAPITWSSTNEKVATVDANGQITGKVGGAAVIVGEFTDMYGVDQHIHILVGVNIKLTEAVIGPDENGDYWKEIEENIWQKVDEDGVPTQPEKYQYDTDGNPTNDNGKPATKDENGHFWVEEPTNIWTPVKDGELMVDDKVWGGDDFTPGTKDDKKVDDFGTKGKSDYWVDMGENVYRHVNEDGKLGPLTGGGTDKNPATDGFTAILDRTQVAGDGHYYYGPLTDEDGITYYLGDNYNNVVQTGKRDGNKLLLSEPDIEHPTDIRYYLIDDKMTPEKPVTIVEPTSLSMDESPMTMEVGDVESRTATVGPVNATNKTITWTSSDPSVASVDANGQVTAKTPGTTTITATVTDSTGKEYKKSYEVTVNDPSTIDLPGGGQPGETFNASGYDWVVIARDGKYALITTTAATGTTAFGSNSTYAGSALQSYMTDFTNTLAANDLTAGAKAKKISGAMQPADIPTPEYDASGGISSVKSDGSKTCFPLSYQEGNAYLVGKSYAKLLRGDMIGSHDCDGGAYQCYWLRSPKSSLHGTLMYHTGELHTTGTYITYFNICARPACWIEVR